MKGHKLATIYSWAVSIGILAVGITLSALIIALMYVSCTR